MTSLTTTCTRRLCFSAGHRVLGHEGGCSHPHGHNYVVHLRARAEALDSVGRIIDFSVLKAVVGGWIDQNWDHAFLFCREDEEIAKIYREHPYWRHAVLDFNPTAENMAMILLVQSSELLQQSGVIVEMVRVEETENCHAESHLPRQ